MINRSEIKKLAKEKIKGHLWEILLPLLIIGAVNAVFSSYSTSVNTDNIFDFSSFMTEFVNSYSYSGVNYFGSIIELVLNIFSVTYVAYLFEFIKTGKTSLNTMWDCFKKNWLRIFIVSLLSGIFIILWGLLFIIPGIIAALSYALVSYIVIDDDKTSGIDVLKKSKEMMKGHKFEYFIFELSFIGWYLLVPFTLGLILIYVVPYVNVSKVLYYEKLKEISE